MLPVIIDASSDNMSPKMLFVTIVSNCSDTRNLGGQHILLTISQDATNQMKGRGKKSNLLRIPNKLHCSIIHIHV
jgi:hypothetical protein